MPRGRRIPNGSGREPGTGTQYHVEADEHKNSESKYHYDGTWYHVGQDYLDVEVRDVAELVAVVRKSSWCSTRPAEEGTLIFKLEAERMGQYRIKPTNYEFHDENPLDERLIERRGTTQQKPREYLP